MPTLARRRRLGERVIPHELPCVSRAVGSAPVHECTQPGFVLQRWPLKQYPPIRLMLPFAFTFALLCATDVSVATTAEVHAALAAATSGTRIVLEVGDYDAIHASNVRGDENAPIVICGADPRAPPRLRGGLQLSSVGWVELAHLSVIGASGNGINIDDGGKLDTPSRHVFIHDVTVRDSGGRGNDDGIKLSGVDDFRIERCTVERWGRGGSAIDMVGCHRGSVDACTFQDRADDPAASGVQMKGGTRAVRITRCRFVHAGQRAVNLGGSTGLDYFRPRPEGFEARDVSVEGSVFIGSQAPIAFVGVDGASVRWNTFYSPQKWLVRILQETRAEGFVPCRAGVFADNLVAYTSTELTTAVNVGSGTEPDSFTFARNAWCCLDDADRKAPSLPTQEKDGVCIGDPRFEDVAALDLRLAADSPALRYGADAWPGGVEKAGLELETQIPFVETRTVDLALPSTAESPRARVSVGKIVLSPTGPRASDEATFTSLPMQAAHPFRDLLPSWNVTTPQHAGFRVEVRVARAGGDFSEWLFVGDWGRLPELPKTLETDGAKVATDFVSGTTTFDRAQVRVRAWSTGNAKDFELTLERLTLCFSDREARVDAPHIPGGPIAGRLPVPPRSQKVEDAAIAGRICSPTSLAMVLAYRGASHPTIDIAKTAFDSSNDIYGNWPRNVQAAFSYGVPGYVTRIASWAEAEALIRARQPIIASIAVKEGQLRGAPYAKTAGHLIVITGFDIHGNVHVNDPAVSDPALAKVVYARSDLDVVWLQRGGTAYILLEKP